MIDDYTMCVASAGAWTWIYALLIRTSLVQFTIGANCALRSTVGRASYVALHADTHGVAVHLSTLTERAAGGRLT